MKISPYKAFHVHMDVSNLGLTELMKAGDYNQNCIQKQSRRLCV